MQLFIFTLHSMHAVVHILSSHFTLNKLGKKISDLSESVASGSDPVKMQTCYQFFAAFLRSLPGETNVREEMER